MAFTTVKNLATTTTLTPQSIELRRQGFGISMEQWNMSNKLLETPNWAQMAFLRKINDIFDVYGITFRTNYEALESLAYLMRHNWIKKPSTFKIQINDKDFNPKFIQYCHLWCNLIYKFNYQIQLNQNPN